MVLSLIVAVLVLGIAYFHWVQGLLSGIISVTLAVLAGSMALGCYESVATGLLGGKAADSANGMMLCVIFATVYGVGRVVFDSLIPGNVRLPLYVDRIGGALCGVIAGIFATGVFAVAAQSMPFGPSAAGFSRYPIAEEKSALVTNARGRQEDAKVVDALAIESDADNLPPKSVEGGMWLAADEMVVNFVAGQSETGALAGNVPFRARHPDLLRELSFSRGGIEGGAKHSAINLGSRKDVAVKAIFAPAALPQLDGESPLVRARKLPLQVKADAAKALLVVRVEVQKSATDSDTRFRFSPGTVRLVVGGKDFHPLGTVYEPGTANLLLSNRIDDYLVAELDKDAGTVGIDLAFAVDRADALAGGAKDEVKLADGAFLEVKRYARVDLADVPIKPGMPDNLGNSNVLLKTDVLSNSIPERLAKTDDAPAAK